MKEEQSKLNDYRLFQVVKEEGPISKSFRIKNMMTNEVWNAKVFDLQKVEQYDMFECLEFNEYVFKSLKKEKYQNSLYLESCFERKGKQYLVVEIWSQRLSTYIEKHQIQPIDKNQVKQILQQVLISICDIYAENYMIRNLRPEHIVKVDQPSYGSFGWKIQSLVYDYRIYGFPSKCQYEFDYDWASNEQKKQRDRFDERLQDEQIVWYLGVLALRLVYGPKFRINEKFKDTDLDLGDLKTKCLPEVYELIVKSVKANLKDRIPLKSFLNLSIFSRVSIASEVKEKFISGNEERIKQSSIMKSTIMRQSSIKKSQTSESIKMTSSSYINNFQSGKRKLQQKQQIKNISRKESKFIQLSEVQAQKIFNEFRWTLEMCLYLAEIKDYTQTAACMRQTTDQDRTVIRYLYFKLAQVNLTILKNLLIRSEVMQSFRESSSSKDLYNDLLRCIEQNQKSTQKKGIISASREYEKRMTKLDLRKLSIFSKFESVVSEIKQLSQQSQVSSEKLVNYFAMINGHYYSTLRNLFNPQNSVVQSRGIKIRALCYFVFSAYIILAVPKISGQKDLTSWLIQNDFSIYKTKFFDEEKIKGSIHVSFADSVEFVKLCEFTKRGSQEPLIQNSQFILKKYFQIDESNAIKEEKMPSKELKRRTSIGNNFQTEKSNNLLKP